LRTFIPAQIGGAIFVMISSMKYTWATVIVLLVGFVHCAAIQAAPIGEPGSPELAKARECQKLIDSEGAIEHYNLALKADPKNNLIYLERGSAYKDSGKYDLALADYNRVLAALPGNVKCLEARARLYDMTGRLKEAIADYDAVIKSGSVGWQTWRHRAICNRRLKNYLESARDFETALKLGGSSCRDSQKMMYYQAEMLFLGNDLKRSLACLNEIIRRFPDFSGAYWTRAKVYDKVGKTDLASKDRLKARKIDEDIDPLNRF
jgi:tetratricopeptide (TPR) repeat protein